jgi:hypothetical protein
MTKIDPTTFKPGDIVHVRGKVVSYDTSSALTAIKFDDDDPRSVDFASHEIVAHFPAIRSWSEIEGRLDKLILDCRTTVNGPTITESIIALLNEIDPKGDA